MLAIFMFSLLHSAALGAEKNMVIKMVTLAPEGSAWMQVFNELNADVAAKTDKKVEFKMYPGGVMGDEKDMLRKMHIGQVQAAALSGMSLSTIFKEMNVFQVPFLFETHDEVDHILGKMDSSLKKGLEEHGYILLGWSEGGFIRLLSTVPINTLDELKKAKVWTWEDAPMAKAIFDEAQISAVPLSIPDVLLGLQTGMVEVVYAPPAGAISLQWFTRVKYLTDVPVIYLAGAIVIKKNVFNTMPQAVQDVIVESFKSFQGRFKEVVRSQNQEAIKVMEKHGIQVLKPSKEEIQKFRTLSSKAMQHLGSRYLSKEVLDEVYGYLEAYRKAKK
jgi:TRAP-type C4-dicarboxylate transport system substrate-binding protein